MKTNDILRRVYSLYPSIGSWAATGMPGIWADAARAKLEMAHYVGPNAHDEIFRAYNNTIKTEDDRAFLRLESTYRAACLLIEAVYNRQPLKAGLFKEEA
jgi:hypothetical protein